MARPRLIADTVILDAILDAFLTGGEGAVSFRLIAARTGLSAPALLGRFGPGKAMLNAGLAHGWTRLMGDLLPISDAPRKASEGRNASIQAILKELSHPHPALLAASLTPGNLAETAATWRRAVIELIVLRTGDREQAEMVFSAWSARQV